MGATKLFILFSFLGIFTCNNSKSYEERVNLSNQYACEQFEIKNEQYGVNTKHTFKVQVIVIGTDTLRLEDLEANLKDFGRQANFEFKIIKTHFDSICTAYPISYQKMLEDNYTPGLITIMIVCDHVRFEEEGDGRIDGAALGIPELDDPTKGRPILFVRSSVAYGKILHHEGSHLLGLSHTFKDYDYDNRGLNCDVRIGDGVPDTVTPIRTGSVGAESCLYYAPEAALKDYSREEIMNMVRNPQSYSPPSCMGEFTEAQVQKMRKMIEVNSRLQDCLIKTK